MTEPMSDSMTQPAGSMAEPWTFGVRPLTQTERAAAALRRVAGLVLALEHDEAAVEWLLADLARAEADLAALVPSDPGPRVGPAVDGPGRVYVDHARHVGAFNPVFPEYRIEVEGDRATGTVNFPLAFEGPPGLVHGGFLGVFFDLVVQHHNCEVGVAGKTTSLQVRYRRPTPLLTDLVFTVHRQLDGDRIRSTAQIHLPAGAGDGDGDSDSGRLVCEAEVQAIAGVRSNLPAVSPRRSGGDL